MSCAIRFYGLGQLIALRSSKLEAHRSPPPLPHQHASSWMKKKIATAL
jgi:hypothetical protein